MYKTFRVDGSADKYRLHIGEGVAMRPEDDAMATHNNQQFSTYDEDNDVKSDGNCASLLVAGWWYNNCFSALLTGPHSTPAGADSFAKLSWRIYDGNFAYVYFPNVVMMVRPKSCLAG